MTAGAVAFWPVRNAARAVEQSPGESKSVKPDSKILVQLIQNARVSVSNSWAVDDQKMFYALQAFDQEPKYEGAGVKLSIFDEAGKVIYEDYFSEVERIYLSYALRKSTPQLILEVSYGGGANFFEMLDYRNGKVVDLMQAVKPDNDFTINAEVRPQLRKGVNPAKEPYQVLLTSGVGLASSAAKYTEVFRYKDGAYRYVGEFPARDVDNYMEKLLAESSSKKEKPARH
jgi:hypothetical protein